MQLSATMQTDLKKFYYNYFKDWTNWFLLIGKLILFGLKIVLFINSPTNFNPSNSSFISFKLSLLSIKKFGTIFFSLEDSAIYKVLLSTIFFLTKLLKSRLNPRILNSFNSQKIYFFNQFDSVKIR